MEPFTTTVFCVCFVVCLCYLLCWWTQRHNWALANKIPGPTRYPLIGNALWFWGELTDNLPTIIMKLFDEYGSVVRLWLVGHHIFFLKDRDDAQRILGDPNIRNRDRISMKLMAPFMGKYGLLALSGDKWKAHRKLITTTFHSKILENFVEIFGEKSKILMKKLEEIEGKSFDAYNVLSLCTLDAICETAIGTAVNSQAVGHSNFVDSLSSSMECIHRRIFRPWLLIDFIYPFTSDGRRAKHLVKKIHAFSESVIAQKMEDVRRGITTAGKKTVSSFLDMWIEASETGESILSPEEMRDEVTAMAFAGLETTATTMSFFLILIALHPEFQADIHKRLDDVFGSDSRPATPEDLKQLPVLERCIKETLRFLPIGALLPREIEQDVDLPSGYTLPAGSIALVVAYAIHRDSSNFVEPNKFWPDRWLPDYVENMNPKAYIPFSAGTWNCVGQKYAQLQMKSILSQVLRSYRVTTPLKLHDLQKLEVCITLTLDHALKHRFHITLHKR